MGSLDLVIEILLSFSQDELGLSLTLLNDLPLTSLSDSDLHLLGDLFLELEPNELFGEDIQGFGDDITLDGFKHGILSDLLMVLQQDSLLFSL